MKSGVYYLYEYKNDQKARNVGFLKFNLNLDSCFLQICARGIPVFHNDTASLCILCPSEESIFVIPCQTITCENHAITCKLTFSSSDFETSDFKQSDFNQSGFKQSDFPNSFCGFLIELPENILLIAIEDGFSFSTKKCLSVVVDNGCEQPALPVAVVDSDCRQPALPESVVSVDCDEASTTTSTAPQQSIRKIQRTDLSILPRKYWNLSNNRFLLHGYYNYNHLLLVEEKNYFLVGVPGIYDKREARAADLFGFPTFSESYTKSLNLSSEENSAQGQFGYWCKKLPVKTE